MPARWLLVQALIAVTLLSGSQAWGHDVSGDNARFLAASSGPAIGPFAYLGAKHMVTGIDHVLFLCGVVFFLRRARDVLAFVSLFTIGHSMTLLCGTLLGTGIDQSLVDAVIGGSVVYKALENVGGLHRWRVDPKLMVFGFGLVHGMGLAGKLQEVVRSQEGLLANLLAFNAGVELGQALVLLVAFALLCLWRERPGFQRQAWVANAAIMSAGFVMIATHATAFVEARA